MSYSSKKKVAIYIFLFSLFLLFSFAFYFFHNRKKDSFNLGNLANISRETILGKNKKNDESEETEEIDEKINEENKNINEEQFNKGYDLFDYLSCYLMGNLVAILITFLLGSYLVSQNKNKEYPKILFSSINSIIGRIAGIFECDKKKDKKDKKVPIQEIELEDLDENGKLKEKGKESKIVIENIEMSQHSAVPIIKQSSNSLNMESIECPLNANMNTNKGKGNSAFKPSEMSSLGNSQEINNFTSKPKLLSSNPNAKIIEIPKDVLEPIEEEKILIKKRKSKSEPLFSSFEGLKMPIFFFFFCYLGSNFLIYPVLFMIFLCFSSCFKFNSSLQYSLRYFKKCFLDHINYNLIFNILGMTATIILLLLNFKESFKEKKIMKKQDTKEFNIMNDNNNNLDNNYIEDNNYIDGESDEK